MMGLENMGEIPFHTVYLHGLVRVGSVKMSKSLGNVVSPVGLIEEYGADALRYALVSGVAAGADSQLSDEKLLHASCLTSDRPLLRACRAIRRDRRRARRRGAPCNR